VKVSLLSPAHNEAKFIAQMIASVQAQSHRNWELLVVDDGSSDSTADVVAKAARADQRIKLVAHGRKLGKVRAFNLAYAASDGDIIALLGGDDLLPRDSLACRADAVAQVGGTEPVVAFFKLRTFSADPRYDGLILPRGNSSSRSGGSITMSRALAELVFPIDEDLVAEDTWLAYAGAGLASTIVERPDVVLHYRIHEGNSYSRAWSFARMNDAMNARHRAFAALLSTGRIDLPAEIREELQRLWAAEQLRYAGKTWRLLLRSGLPIIDRAAMAAMSNPVLFKIRSRFYRLFTGHRGR
jgi:glycosyltransferase involved in cell wall biosynthesis